MIKANDVMTQSLATCSPDDSAAQAASIMRDRNIGDVLVVDQGKLCGIVTDRDLALRALTSKSDPLQMPLRDFMSEDVITGKTDWNMRKVANTMAKNQIRRLPIVDDERLVGIISLGDIARNENRKNIITKSLKAISSTPIETKSNQGKQIGAIVGIGLMALTSTAIAMLTWNRSGKELRKQAADTRLYQSAQEAVNIARDRVDEAAKSKRARNIRHQIQTNMKDLSYQLPRIEYKPPRRKPQAWFR